MAKCEKCGYPVESIVTTFVDKNKEQHLCPNCYTSAAYHKELVFEDNPEFICDVTGRAGAVKYLTRDEHYTLSTPIMLRLVEHNLTPEEYFKLIGKYGEHSYMLHDDFYTENGEAIQPIWD